MVQSIPVHNEDGFTAIAFSLPEILRKWGGQLRELSLDSACKISHLFVVIFIHKNQSGNTNGSHFEVYALLGEVAGSGSPLGYLLIRSAEGSEPGGKKRKISLRASGSF